MPPKSRPEPPASRMRWLLKAALVLALVAVFLGSVIWAGRWALEQLAGSDRYTIDFADIACEAPAGMERAKFLDEVRYYASPDLPNRVNLLDEKLPGVLTASFAKHPWVEKVERVDIEAPKRVAVKLVHRTPVLAVQVGADLLAVDAAGILLPRNAPTRGLPLYDGEPKAPRAVGHRWGDPNIEAAARKLRKS